MLDIIAKVIYKHEVKKDQKNRDKFYEVFGCYPEADDIYVR